MPAQAIGRVAPDILKGVFRKHGFAQGQILSAWPAIAGDELARFTAPEKIRWPRRGQNAQPGQDPALAILVLRVEGPVAIEVQHSTPQLIDRINAFFGYRAIGKIQIVQGPLPRRPLPQKRHLRPLSSGEENKLKSHLGLVDDAGLRRALLRLGRGVMGST
jgi:hypothetical protein